MLEFRGIAGVILPVRTDDMHADEARFAATLDFPFELGKQFPIQRHTADNDGRYGWRIDHAVSVNAGYEGYMRVLVHEPRRRVSRLLRQIHEVAAHRLHIETIRGNAGQ